MSRLRQRIVEEFTAWASARGIVPEGAAGVEWRDRIAVLLQCRAELDRPDPTRWRSGDVHALFMDHVAPRQVDAWGLAAHGPDSVRDYLRFLDDTGRLHPASARPAALLKELDRLAAKFPAAMADTGTWQPAKRILTAMLGDGVRPDGDQAGIDAWVARHNAGGAREHILVSGGRVATVPAGRPPVRHLIWPDLPCDCGCTRRARSAPVALPDDAALAGAVSTVGAALLRDLAALAGWVGPDGRAVDTRGEPRKADRPALLAATGPSDTAPLWQTAIEFDVVRLHRGRVVRGPGADLAGAVLAGTAPAREALELWSDLADALIHPITPMHAEKGTAHLRGWLDPWTPLFLGLLYATGGRADLRELTDRLLEEQAGRLPAGDPGLFAGIAATAIHNILATLARHGAVTVTGAGPTVELTDLGTYLVRRRVLAEGAEASPASLDSAPAGP